MKNIAALILLIFFSLLINPFCIHAQEENATAVTQGNRYISFKIKAIDKYNSRIEHQQKQLLNKLKKKEKRFEHKLKKSDSLAYAQYKKQRSPSFDSISKVSKSDTGSTAAKFAKNRNPTIDSLRGVQSFVQSKSGQPANSLKSPAADSANKIEKSDTSQISPADTGSIASLSKNKTTAADSLRKIQSLMSKSGLSASAAQGQGTTAELNSAQGKLNFRAYITQLITQRMNSLKSLAASNSNVPGLTGIEKQVFYGKAKMSVYKDMEEDPTKAEDKAMDYLQGTPGFDKYLQSATGGSGAGYGGAASGADMGRMGFQTKGLMQASLLKQFGGNMSGVTKQLSAGMQQFQDKQKDLNDLKEAKQSVQQLTGTDKPGFKVNPMRGLPFWKRIQKQYNWQTTRPVLNSNTPALFDISAMAGYRQSPKLTYGLGAVSSFGLGQSWQDIHFSFQGVGLRSFVTWAWQYGIGFYTGYERMYKQAAFTGGSQPISSEVTQSPHNSTDYSESVLVGLTKSYRINDKWDGQVQLLYNIWWQQLGLPSPIVLRFATIQK